MELRLTFKEKEIREIYNESFETRDKDFGERLNERRRATIVFAALTIFFFGLVYFHRDWSYYGLFFFGLTLIFILWTWTLKMRHNRKLKAEKDTVETFINKLRTIESIKYSYDNSTIKYLESEKLVAEINWNDITSFVKTDKFIYVYAKNPNQNMLIPFVTADKNELETFEKILEARLQNAR